MIKSNCYVCDSENTIYEYTIKGEEPYAINIDHYYHCFSCGADYILCNHFLVFEV
jgi:hypothetical protein